MASIEDGERRIAEADRKYEFAPRDWGEKVNMTLKDVMKEGVATYDWVTRKALELYQRVEEGNASENTLRKLLDTIAKVTSLKISACTETMRIVGDIGKDEKTMAEKIATIAKVIESPFGKIVMERAQQLEKKGKLDDDTDAGS